LICEEDFIPNGIKQAFEGGCFLLYDSCFDLCDGMVFFATESDLIHLSNNKLWIIDGTLKVVHDVL
jgi:hypothetical protein